MPPIQEHHIQVARTARFFTLDPGRGSHDRTNSFGGVEHVSEIWICLHGFAQLASRFLSRLEPLSSPDRLIVAPEALNRFYLDTAPRPHGPDAKIGATWMTREDREHEIRDYVSYLDQLTRHVVDGNDKRHRKLVVLGFSQGVATACRWLSMGEETPDALVLWSGHIPLDLDLAQYAPRWSAVPVFVVWGDEDAKVNAPGIARDRSRFAAAGLRVEYLEFRGGHQLDDQTLRELASRF